MEMFFVVSGSVDEVFETKKVIRSSSFQRKVVYTFRAVKRLSRAVLKKLNVSFMLAVEQAI